MSRAFFYGYCVGDVSSVVQVPVVLVSLVCEDKQWFECGHGLDVDNTDRKLSFCAWTLLPKHPEVRNGRVIPPRMMYGFWQ